VSEPKQAAKARPRIHDIRVILEPEVIYGARRVLVRVRLVDGQERETSVMHPVDYLRCYFDQVWECLGQAIKEDVMSHGDNKETENE